MAKLKRKRIPAWLHGPVYAAVRGALATMGAGSLEVNLVRARALARLYAGLPLNRRRVRRAEENLAVAFPGWSEERRRVAAVRSYEHLFTLAVETVYTPRLVTDDSWGERLRLANLGECVQDVLSRRPVILITGHCGNWELLGYGLGLLGLRMHAIYRPLDVRPLDRWVKETREARGLKLMDKFGAMRALPEVMEAGEPVAFVADQNGGDRGVFVPYFGRLASSYKSIGLMAQRFRAPIVCGQARRLDWSRDAGREGGAAEEVGGIGFAAWEGEPFRYRLEVVDTIWPEDWERQPDPLFYLTARYRRAIEKMVRLAPEQYLWMHRYWKSRPRHERLGRPIPASLVEKIRALPWMTEADVEGVIEWSRRDGAEVGARGESLR